MPYRMAGIDVHKKMVAVVVADVEVEDEYQFERRWYGSNPEQLRVLSEWLIEQQVEEVVMESTAQYWKPVWGALERFWKATCQSREGAGRMSRFAPSSGETRLSGRIGSLGICAANTRRNRLYRSARLLSL